MTDVKQFAPGSEGAETLQSLLRAEAAATAKYLEYKKAAADWETWRNKRRAEVRAFVGNAAMVKIGELPVLTDAPKDQFSEVRFTAEYPDLAAEFTRVRAKEYLDTEALAAAHPELAAKFTVRTFVNKSDI